ncbi:MAG TPA: UDP-N-acetylmuramate dehydrogenase [Anaerolineae bacterium]|nr:UDP-N-acetylmuramate dehydrogenase [Anaerolineae bacterium]HPL26992.1 UDP-N-acetylmuramate dehydrogenase [Anaerolineae bacterium]
MAEQLRAAGWLGRLSAQAPLAPYTTFRIGGAADLVVEATNSAELQQAWQLAHECEVACLVLGRGSNVLVSDRGVRGLVVLNRCIGWEISPSGTLTVASGMPLTEVAERTGAAGWAGLEWAVGIPGSVGGAIVGNAGAHGGYVGDVLTGITVLDHGQVRGLTRDELGLGYRTSMLKTMPNCNGRPIILEAAFGLRPEDARALRQRMSDLLQWRADRQPQQPSAGSVFKRTTQYPAGFLIEQAGLKGKRLGGAQVSPQHANFVVNTGDATASDVKALVEEIRETVAARFGLGLELEIELVGDW